MSRKFWLSYQEIARRQFSTPVLIPTGAKRDKGVWPSFFANDLQHNARNVRRKNVQIVHVDDGDHVLSKIVFSEPATIVFGRDE